MNPSQCRETLEKVRAYTAGRLSDEEAHGVERLVCGDLEAPRRLTWFYSGRSP